MSLNISPPPVLQGDAQSQLQRLQRYLFCISEQLNMALSSLEQRAVVLQTSGGGAVSEERLTADMDQQYRNLKSLIIKTAHTVQVEMDRVISQLDSKYLAISDWGVYREEISREIVDTAEKTVESFNYDASISDLAEMAADFEAYRVEASGYITRGIIGYDDENFPIIGIAIGQDLKSKTVTIDGVEYQEIDTTQNLATYTADRITFWINGVPMAYLSNGELVITRAIITDSIRLGNWDIAVNAQDGLTVQKRIGNELDLSGNNTFTIAADKVQAIVGDLDLSANDTVSISADKVQAVIQDVDLEANHAVQLIAGEVAAARQTADAATIYSATEPPALPIDPGRRWIDTGVNPWRLRQWTGAHLPNDRELNFNIWGHGKNLLPPVYASQTLNGVTFTVHGNGSITVNGTATARAQFAISRTTESRVYARAGKTYTLFSVGSGEGAGFYSYVMTVSGNRQVANATKKTFTLDADDTLYAAIAVNQGTTVNNVTVYPQLEEGSVATAYEPFQWKPAVHLDNSFSQIQRMGAQIGCRARQDVRRNLLPPVYASQTLNGVTFAVNADGSVTINGTATARAQFAISRTTASYVHGWAGKTYTLFGVGSGESANFYAYVMTVNGGQRVADNAKKTFTLSADDDLYVAIAVAQGATVDNVTVYPQLEEGAMATAYQPYVEIETLAGRDRVNLTACGKNLLAPVYTSKTMNGVTFTVNADGSVTVNGTATARAQFAFTPTVASYIPATKGTRYALFGVGSGEGTGFYAYAMTVTGNRQVANATKKTFTMDVDDTLYVAMAVTQGTTVNNVTVYPQLERGDAATDYERYTDLGSLEIDFDSPVYGAAGAEDVVEVSEDGELTLQRNSARREMTYVGASSLACAEGVYPHSFNLVAARAVRDFPAACSHFRRISALEPASRRTAGTMCTGVTDAGVPTVWFFSTLATADAMREYFSAQAAAGTPVTLVYATADATTEPLGTVEPLAPRAGQVNLCTDAGGVSAAVTASGWATVSDTAEMEAALGEAGLQAQQAQIAAEAAAENLERRVRLDSGGLHVGDSQTDNELLLQSAMMHFVINGERVSTIASDYHRFGNMEIRTPSSVGGIVIQSVQ